MPGAGAGAGAGAVLLFYLEPEPEPKPKCLLRIGAGAGAHSDVHGSASLELDWLRFEPGAGATLLKIIGRALMLISATSKRFFPCNAIGIMLKFRNYTRPIQNDTHALMIIFRIDAYAESL